MSTGEVVVDLLDHLSQFGFLLSLDYTKVFDLLDPTLTVPLLVRLGWSSDLVRVLDLVWTQRFPVSYASCPVERACDASRRPDGPTHHAGWVGCTLRLAVLNMTSCAGCMWMKALAALPGLGDVSICGASGLLVWAFLKMKEKLLPLGVLRRTGVVLRHPPSSVHFPLGVAARLQSLHSVPSSQPCFCKSNIKLHQHRPQTVG